jgi:hypothetical protein
MTGSDYCEKHVDGLQPTLLSCQIHKHSIARTIKRILTKVGSMDTHYDILLVKIFAEVREKCICDKTGIKSS